MGIREKLKWLDPFTYVDILLEKVNPSRNAWIDWPVHLASAFLFAWIFYTFIGFLAGTSAPLWIVLSPSMEPVLYRGDVVLLLGAKADPINALAVKLDAPLEGKAFWDFAKIEYETDPQGNTVAKKIVFNEQQAFEIKKDGDTIIYFSQYRQEPIVHRAVMKIIATDGNFFLTKGDSVHNPTIDQDCGRVINNVPERACITLYPVQEKEVQGKMLFKIPLLGYVKLLLFDDLQNLIFGCPKGRTCYFP